MKAKAVFFSIPTTDINRSAEFYRKAFGWSIDVFDCPDSTEKMGMIHSEGVEGCIFVHDKFQPAKDGTQISFEVDDIDETLEKIEKFGGKTLMPKGKIGCEDKGYCALFADSEGNSVGLYSK